MRDTPCKNCVFAIYDGETQVDCEAKLLDIYRSQGTEILEAYDEEKEFYVIKSRQCMMARPPAWKNKPHPLPLLAQARKEITLRYEVIIPITDSDTMADVLKTVLSIERQCLPPERIIFAIHVNSKFRPTQFRDIYDGKWKVQIILEQDATPERILDICITALQKQTGYYVVTRPGATFSNYKLMYNLDILLHDKMESVVCIEGHQFLAFMKVFAHEIGKGDIKHKLDAILSEHPEWKYLKKTEHDLNF